MKIIDFQVLNLNSSTSSTSIKFNKDINIITGRNGCGKTSTLKLMWLIMSGNIKRVISECDFSLVLLNTDEYSLTIIKNKNNEVIYFIFDDKKNRIEFNRALEDKSNKKNSLRYLELNKVAYKSLASKILLDQSFSNLNQIINSASAKISEIGETIYFPTFRRIEGGFSSEKYTNNIDISENLQDAMSLFSKSFSKGRHLFVSSLSMKDISQLLLREYSNLNDRISKNTNALSQEIISSIKNYDNKEDDIKISKILLGSILEKIENIEKKRTEIMHPIEAVQDVVKTIFNHKGIKFGNNLSFGDAATAVNSEQLSAGEKQFLSFICYNAFFNNAIFIIDEPELSLHVDWQRTFFSILTKQNPSNQFIVATHSPFIYSKYPEKEVLLSNDKGEAEE